MNRLVLSLFLLTFFSCSTELMDSHIIDEEEPNELTYQANEIEEGNIYRGFIDNPVGNVADTDLFKIWKPSGTVIVFEFESEDEKFRPYVGHASSSGQNEFVLFPMPGRHIAEFVTAVSGWHYFEVGDMRNVFEEGGKYGGFKYYFRVRSYHLCNDRPEKVLKTGKEYSGSFSDTYGNIEAVSVEIEENRYHQINLFSMNENVSDKFMFIYDCDARQTIIGNDDMDYYSRQYDPLIYGRLERKSDIILIIGRILANLTKTATDEFNISLKIQEPDRELEPNNLYSYANRTGMGPVSGELSSKPVIISGVSGDDVDIFKYSFQRGELVNFTIETENSREYMAQFWIGSYSETGSMILPLRFSQLSGEKTHNVNMFIPFTGAGYLFLEGSGVPYTFYVEKRDNVPSLFSFDNRVYEKFNTPDCKWVFRKWKMPLEGDVFEIKVSGRESPAGIHVFSSDYYPYAFVPPDDNNRFYIHRYEKTEELVLGLFFSNCDQDIENDMELRIVPEKANYVKWDYGFETMPIEISGNGSYQGFIDTDNYFVENIFKFEAWADGILHLTTAADINSLNSFHINTVITLLEDESEVAKNINMIEFMNHNRYSYLKYPVVKGAQYQVRTGPYMSSSSHVPSMNIVGHYILDIRIK